MTNNSKSWIEIFLLPLVVAIVGSVATFVVAYFQSKSTIEIRRAQLENSERISAAERDSAEKRFRSEQQVNILEIFIERFFSKDQKEKELAVKMLAAIDPRLASSIANVIARDVGESDEVRIAARKIC